MSANCPLLATTNENELLRSFRDHCSYLKCAMILINVIMASCSLVHLLKGEAKKIA